MEFDKTSTYITVSRNVNDIVRRVTVVLYKRCTSDPTVDSSVAPLPVADMTVNAATLAISGNTSVWKTSDTDDPGDLYYIEQTVTFNKTESTFTLSKDGWEGPVRRPTDRDVLFEISPSAKYYRNNRYDLNIKQTLSVSMTTIGYVGVPELRSNYMEYVTGNILRIPYKNCPDEIELKAYIGGREVKSITLYAEDITDKPVYLGKAKTREEVASILGSQPSDGKLYTVIWYPDDSYASKDLYKKGAVLYKNGESYSALEQVTSENASVFLDMVLSVTSDGNISDGLISWFNTIVVDTLDANNIFARQGEIDELKSKMITTETLDSTEITVKNSIHSDGYGTKPNGFSLGNDGILHASGAVLNGTINATSFAIENTSIVFKHLDMSHTAQNDSYDIDVMDISMYDYALVSMTIGDPSTNIPSSVTGGISTHLANEKGGAKFSFGSLSYTSPVSNIYSNFTFNLKYISNSIEVDGPKYIRISATNGKAGLRINAKVAMLLFKNIS